MREAIAKGGLAVDAAAERELKQRCRGSSRVSMRTEPPAKSAGMSGVNVLTIVTLSRMSDGNRSSGIAARSGSGLGSGAPLSSEFV